MVKKVAALFNYRPLTVLALITAIHTLAYGVGYVIPTSGFGATVLYNTVTDIASGFAVGVAFLVVGAYSIWAWITDNTRHISWSSGIMAFFWLFAAFTYFVAGAYGLGVGIGLVWSLLSGYLAFAHKNKDDTVMVLANQHFIRILDGEVDDLPNSVLD